MENDLISRAALINEMESHIYWGDSVIGLLEVAKSAPAVDAEPVRHGRWVYGEDVDIQCSECGRDAMSDWMKYTQVYSPYCPWCGAKMAAKEDDHE